jgi:hypothetical protein
MPDEGLSFDGTTAVLGGGRRPPDTRATRRAFGLGFDAGGSMALLESLGITKLLEIGLNTLLVFRLGTLLIRMRSATVEAGRGPSGPLSIENGFRSGSGCSSPLVFGAKVAILGFGE